MEKLDFMSINSKTLRQRNRTGIHGRKKNSSAISSLTKFSQALLNIKGLATKQTLLTVNCY